MYQPPMYQPGVMVPGTADMSGVLAAQTQNMQNNMTKPYECYKIDKDNDEEDLNIDKNNDYKGYIVPKIVTDDWGFYFGISKSNYHPYYNYKTSAPDIREAYINATNSKDTQYNTTKNENNDGKIWGEQADDLAILRRVVKQGPIMTAKSHIIPTIIFFIVINVIILIVYLVKNDISGMAIGSIFGIVNFIFIVSLGITWYQINHGLKAQGLGNWRNLQNDVRTAASKNNSTGTLLESIKTMPVTLYDEPPANLSYGYPPNGYPPNGYPSAPQAPPPTLGQEILSGVGKGIGSIASEFFKSLFTKSSNTK